MILADNGSAWFMSGVPDERWTNTDLNALRGVLGSNFEAVDEWSLMIDPNSDQARQSVDGGNSSVGWIDSTGSYQAPGTVPSPATVSVQARSVAEPTAVGSSAVTIVPPPSITSLSPSPLYRATSPLPSPAARFRAGPWSSLAGPTFRRPLCPPLSWQRSLSEPGRQRDRHQPGWRRFQHRDGGRGEPASHGYGLAHQRHCEGPAEPAVHGHSAELGKPGRDLEGHWGSRR